MEINEKHKKFYAVLDKIAEGKQIAENVYHGAQIPDKKLKNASEKLKVTGNEVIFLLVDDTTFGSAKDAFLITSWGIRYKEDGEWAFSWDVLAKDYKIVPHADKDMAVVRKNDGSQEFTIKFYIATEFKKEALIKIINDGIAIFSDAAETEAPVTSDKNAAPPTQSAPEPDAEDQDDDEEIEDAEEESDENDDDDTNGGDEFEFDDDDDTEAISGGEIDGSDGPAFCEKCGAKLEAGALFCQKCGNKIGSSAPTENQFDKKPTPPQSPRNGAGDSEQVSVCKIDIYNYFCGSVEAIQQLFLNIRTRYIGALNITRNHLIVQGNDEDNFINNVQYITTVGVRTSPYATMEDMFLKLPRNVEVQDTAILLNSFIPFTAKSPDFVDGTITTTMHELGKIESGKTVDLFAPFSEMVAGWLNNLQRDNSWQNAVTYRHRVSSCKLLSDKQEDLAAFIDECILPCVPQEHLDENRIVIEKARDYSKFRILANVEPYISILDIIQGKEQEGTIIQLVEGHFLPSETTSCVLQVSVIEMQLQKTETGIADLSADFRDITTAVNAMLTRHVSV